MNKLATFALLSTVIASSAVAKEIKHIDKTLDIGEGQLIALHIPVGTLNVETCDCDKIELQITIEPSDHGWSFFGSADVDVDDIELKVKERNNRIILKIDDDDIKQQWTVKLPVSSPLAIELGVGEVEVSHFSNDLNIEVGVGSVNVDIDNNKYKTIMLESGVGETGIGGFKSGVSTERSIVSSSSHYRGDGEYSVNIEVGVGEADVH